MTNVIDHKNNSSGPGSRKARVLAARLSAVQAVYQMHSNEQSAKDVMDEFVRGRLGHTLDDDSDDVEMVLPDGTLFKAIVAGLSTRHKDIESIVSAAIQKSKRVQAQSSAPLDPLLQSILYCGAFELLAHHDIDAPIIISDYLNVTHSFYDQGEAKLVNGVLDTVNKAVRD